MAATRTTEPESTALSSTRHARLPLATRRRRPGPLSLSVCVAICLQVFDTKRCAIVTLENSNMFLLMTIKRSYLAHPQRQIADAPHARAPARSPTPNDISVHTHTHACSEARHADGSRTHAHARNGPATDARPLLLMLVLQLPLAAPHSSSPCCPSSLPPFPPSTQTIVRVRRTGSGAAGCSGAARPQTTPAAVVRMASAAGPPRRASRC